MSDFASELKHARSSDVVTETETAAAMATEPTAEVQDDGQSDHMTDGHDFTAGLPVGSKAVTQSVADKAQRGLDVADEIPKIKIAGKEFSSLDEAIKYAEELEMDKREQSAYIEGVKATQKVEAAEPKVVTKSLEEEVEEMIFENPREAIKKLVEGTEKRIFEAYNKMTTEQRVQAEQESAKQALWDNFYQDNTDLADSREYVDFMLSRNPGLLGKQIPDALKELADISRKGLRISKQAALPRTELPSKPAITAGASNGATVGAVEATAEQEMDFVTALKQIRKRK